VPKATIIRHFRSSEIVQVDGIRVSDDLRAIALSCQIGEMIWLLLPRNGKGPNAPTEKNLALSAAHEEIHNELRAFAPLEVFPEPEVSAQVLVGGPGGHAPSRDELPGRRRSPSRAVGEATREQGTPPRRNPEEAAALVSPLCYVRQLVVRPSGVRGQTEAVAGESGDLFELYRVERKIKRIESGMKQQDETGVARLEIKLQKLRALRDEIAEAMHVFCLQRPRIRRLRRR
jgi:hypothetical protein